MPAAPSTSERTLDEKADSCCGWYGWLEPRGRSTPVAESSLRPPDMISSISDCSWGMQARSGVLGASAPYPRVSDDV